MTNTPGQRIKQLRKENKMSIAELAKGTEVSEKYIRDLENDLIEPNLTVMAKIALVFGVSVNKLMMGINDPE